MASTTHEAEQETRIGKLEQLVAANTVQIDALEKTVASISQPTNWLVVIGSVVTTFGMMVAFVKLISDPIVGQVSDVKGALTTQIVDLTREHSAFLNRFNEHVEDGHPHSVLAVLEANKEADFERARSLEERRKDAWASNEKELERIRVEMKQIEDYTHQILGAKKP